MSALGPVTALYERELRAYFLSPLAYVVMAAVLAGNGIVFTIILAFLNDPLSPPGRPFDLFFGGTPFFYLLISFVAPALTMGLLAEETRSGSLELLLTAPVTEAQIVLAKYAAALTFWVVIWAPTVAYAVVVDRYGPLDWGVVAAGYLGVFLVGALLLALGLFASATTSQQLVAAVVGFILAFGLIGLSLVEFLVRSQELRDLVGHVSIPAHMVEFSKGIVDTRRLVFYATTVAFVLFVTTLVLARRRRR